MRKVDQLSKEELSEFMRSLPIVAFHPKLAHISGSAKAGLFLSQALYWTDRAAEDRNGWFFKSGDDWYIETALTRRNQETARRTLREKGFLEEEKAQKGGYVGFRLNLVAISEALEKLQGETGEPSFTRIVGERPN